MTSIGSVSQVLPKIGNQTDKWICVSFSVASNLVGDGKIEASFCVRYRNS